MNIAVFTNILNPYRTSFFEDINKYAVEWGHSFRVYAMTGEKSDRPWKYEEFEKDYTRLLKSKTLLIKGVYLHFNFELEHELKEYRPDIVVMAGSYLQPTVIKLVRLKKKYDYMMFFWSESHFKETRTYNSLLLNIREKLRQRILNKMDGFWYPGERAKEFVDHYKNPDAVLIQVPNTVEDAFFNIKEDNSSKKNNHPKILFTPARLHPAKGILEFLEIIKSVPNDSYIWLIAGDGELKDSILNKVREYGLNVQLLGNLSPEHVHEYYKKCDIFLLPSMSDPNPLTCVEALWSRLPLLVSDHVGNGPEVIRNGVNGYIFNYENTDETVESLKKLLYAEPQWFKQASDESHLIAEHYFKQSLVAQRTLENTIQTKNRG